MTIKSFIIISAIIGAFAHDGKSMDVDPVSSDPTGTCVGTQNLKINVNNGNLSGCISGSWMKLNGSSGSGTVSAGISGQVAHYGSNGTTVSGVSGLTPSGTAGQLQTTNGSGLFGTPISVGNTGTDIPRLASGLLAPSILPTPTNLALGAIFTIDCSTDTPADFVQTINSDGSVSCANPKHLNGVLIPASKVLTTNSNSQTINNSFSGTVINFDYYLLTGISMQDTIVTTNCYTITIVSGVITLSAPFTCPTT